MHCISINTSCRHCVWRHSQKRQRQRQAEIQRHEFNCTLDKNCDYASKKQKIDRAWHSRLRCNSFFQAHEGWKHSGASPLCLSRILKSTTVRLCLWTCLSQAIKEKQMNTAGCNQHVSGLANAFHYSSGCYKKEAHAFPIRMLREAATSIHIHSPRVLRWIRFKWCHLTATGIRGKMLPAFTVAMETV